jgi:hypothetical protein
MASPPTKSQEKYESYPSYQSYSAYAGDDRTCYNRAS